MALYLIDKQYGENGLVLAAKDPDAKVVLIQDGVYLRPTDVKEVYSVAEDVNKRGLAESLPSSIKQIGYDELIDLIVDNKVINFC